MSEDNTKRKYTLGYSVGSKGKLGREITGGSDARKQNRRVNARLGAMYGDWYSKLNDKQPKGPDWDKPVNKDPKYKAEAGSGSVPSGTNTHAPKKLQRRKDGSWGAC